MSCNNSSCNSDVVSVSSVTVYPQAVNLSPGSYCYDLYAVVKPDNAANRIVIWHSSDTSVAEVDLYSGVVYAKSIGTAKITAVASNGSGISDYCMVNVGGAIPVQSVNFHETDISLEKGTVYVPPVSVCPSNATNKSLAWYTSNTSVATVTDGMIHAKEEGTAVITAVSTDQSNKSSSLTVTVTNNRLVTCVRLRPVSKTLTVGDFMYLECIVCPENALDRTVRWSSSNSDVVSVDQNGRITAKAPGNATVFADANDTSGKYGTCYVTVNAAVPVTGISVCPCKRTMTVGIDEYLNPTVLPENAADKTVIYTSSDSLIATVEQYSGRIHPKLAGDVTVTATTADGGYSQSCEITVEQTVEGADTYINSMATINNIILFKNMCDYNEHEYLTGMITECDRDLIRKDLLNSINEIRADYAVLNPDSDFVYQYFKGRNRHADDTYPFNREEYTSPQEDNEYDNPEDKLAITIIQRTLELLGYFEPEDDYEYGIYDEATQTALAEYQDDELEQPSFNADSYAHMFGPETATIRTEERIRLLHKLRFVHNQVAREVSNRVAGRTDETTIRGAGLSSDYGYADVMKTVPAIKTEYIWEVKPWGEKYRVLNGIGAIQLARYINAWNREFQTYNGPKYTAKQGYSVGRFAIEITPFNDSYILVESNSAPAEDIRSGLVHYKVIDKTDYPRSEYAKQYSLEKRADENRQPHYSPTLSPAYGYAFSHETEIGNADLAIKIVGIAVLGTAALVLVLYGGEIVPIATSALQALAAFLFSSPVSAIA